MPFPFFPPKVCVRACVKNRVAVEKSIFFSQLTGTAAVRENIIYHYVPVSCLPQKENGLFSSVKFNLIKRVKEKREI